MAGGGLGEWELSPAVSTTRAWSKKHVDGGIGNGFWHKLVKASKGLDVMGLSGEVTGQDSRTVPTCNSDKTHH